MCEHLKMDQAETLDIAQNAWITQNIQKNDNDLEF
jgi:hypothetical protein